MLLIKSYYYYYYYYLIIITITITITIIIIIIIIINQIPYCKYYYNQPIYSPQTWPI